MDAAVERRPLDVRVGSELGEPCGVGLDDVDAQLRDGGYAREPEAGFKPLHVGSPAGPVADLDPSRSGRQRREGRQRQGDRGQAFSHAR